MTKLILAPDEDDGDALEFVSRFANGETLSAWLSPADDDVQAQRRIGAAVVLREMAEQMLSDLEECGDPDCDQCFELGKWHRRLEARAAELCGLVGGTQ